MEAAAVAIKGLDFDSIAVELFNRASLCVSEFYFTNQKQLIACKLVINYAN
jgi:hypothetical protein